MKAVHSYNHKPSANFIGKGRKRNPRFFGVEIETYPSRNNYAGREYAINRLEEFESRAGFGQDEFIYLKNDSSLYEGHGFEIVTHPFTREWMYNKKAFAGLDKCSLSSLPYSSTGIHVHVSRNSMSENTVAKLLYFFSLEKTDSLLTTIGQRNWNTYCEKPLKGDASYFLRTKTLRRRHSAINVRNQHTIEFRFFKGNVAPEAVYRAVEFADAIVNYCTSTGVTKLSPEAFVEYIKTERREASKTSRSYKYPYLRKFITKK